MKNSKEVCGVNTTHLQNEIKGLIRGQPLITNKVLAERMGVSPGYITKLLNYDSNFTVDTLNKLVDAANGILKISIEKKNEKN